MTRSVAFIWLVMLVGCAQVPQFESSTGPDRYQVAETALRFLMDANSGQGVERDYYSAYVIRPGEFTSQLVAAFSHYKPRVVSDIEVSTQNGGAVDKATGKPVKLWSVKIIEMQGDRAVVAVGWYSGNLAAGGHTLNLRKINGRWSVVFEKMNVIS